MFAVASSFSSLPPAGFGRYPFAGSVVMSSTGLGARQIWVRFTALTHPGWVTSGKLLSLSEPGYVTKHLVQAWCIVMSQEKRGAANIIITII